MTKRYSDSIHYRLIFQWFFKIFIIISLLFCFALIPLLMETKNTFSDLQLEKRKQMLHNGTSQLSSTVTGILSSSFSLRSDSRFIQLYHKNIDYSTISITTQNQLQKSFENLKNTFNNTVVHIALQLDKDVAITSSSVFFENQLDYYPYFFQVNDLDYDQWAAYLSDIGTGFTDICHIKTYSSEYDAIIFVTPWTNDSYLYACIDISNIKKLIIEEAAQNTCYFTITSSNGSVLYSDLPANILKYQTFSEGCSAGQIKISVHVPNSVFHQNMKPFYIFFGAYISFCIMLCVSVIVFGSKHATRPIKNIIDVLEQSKNLRPSDTISAQPRALNGFDYIANSIINADRNIEQYQTTLQMQQKILQTRFFEKALGGQLVSKSDICDFHSCFPNFPESYCLLLIKLWTYANETATTLYSEPILLFQAFLEAELSCVYQQQLNESELILILSEENYALSHETLDFVINNINQEEPIYHASYVASDICRHLEDLPTAYQKLRAMSESNSTDCQTQLCTVTDYKEGSKIPVTMIDLMTLYTAITSGNLELSLNRLAYYSDELNQPKKRSFARPVYETICSMLTYIKIDYSQTLVEQYIPAFQSNKSLYEQLSVTVTDFCSLISEYNNVNQDFFTQELSNYIDAHYTDCDICLTSLKTHFKCSESTIRKAFKRVTDVPIARYIEQKRMILANRLLAQNEKTVTEIALECGYALPHSFYKAYKRVYGHAPTLSNNMGGKADENKL